MKCKMQYSYEIKNDHRLRFWISLYSLFQLLKRRKKTKGLCQISYWICKAFAILEKLTTCLFFFCLCKKAHCKKKVALRTQTLLAWPDIAMLFQTDWKISLTFLSRKKRVNFSIELSLVQYIQVILNLPFKFYETLVEVTGNPETMRVWEMRRGEGLWARKTLSSTQRNIKCVTKMNTKP
jgi:hypothetical protein